MHVNHHGIHNNYCNSKYAIQVVCTACHKAKFARKTNWKTHQNKFLPNKTQSSTKEKERYKSTLPSLQIVMLTTSKDKYQSLNSFSVDTDGVYFIIGNSANGGICNIKSMFVGDFKNQKVTLITAEGKQSRMMLAKIGHMTYLTLSMTQNHHIAY
jgi:hypothetical protein